MTQLVSIIACWSQTIQDNLLILFENDTWSSEIGPSNQVHCQLVHLVQREHDVINVMNTSDRARMRVAMYIKYIIASMSVGLVQGSSEEDIHLRQYSCVYSGKHLKLITRNKMGKEKEVPDEKRKMKCVSLCILLVVDRSHSMGIALAWVSWRIYRHSCKYRENVIPNTEASATLPHHTQWKLVFPVKPTQSAPNPFPPALLLSNHFTSSSTSSSTFISSNFNN